MTEEEKIVEFVRDLRHRARSQRHWRRRIAQFGFAVDATDDGWMITALPRRRVICPVPTDLMA